VIYTAADYKDWWYRHMPKGPVWPVDASITPVWDSLLDALSQEPARLSAVLGQILDALIPSATMRAELLPEWEAFLGLTPQAADSTATRATAIVAKLGEYLSPSLPELQARATALKPGATVTHHEYKRFRMGVSVMGEPLNGLQFLVTWHVTYTGPADATFEAAMRAVSPDHTTLLFTVL